MNLSSIVFGLSMAVLLHTIAIIIILMILIRHQDNHRR